MATNQTTTGQTISQTLEMIRVPLTNQASQALKALAAIATSLGMKDTTIRLNKAVGSLESDTFSIIVAGRFKNGKSTLMNALLGRPTHPIPELANGHGPMPVDALPTTATLTSIYYAEKPTVRMWRYDGTHEDWSLAKYLRDAVVRDNEEENRKFFGPIRQFEFGFPAELCKSGVTLYDSPGLDDMPERTEVTRQAVKSCDAAIVVYRSDVLAGEEERRFVREVILGSGTRVFTVLNVWGDAQINERFKTFVWNRLVKDERNGPAYAGQDFAAQDIFFVQALAAESGKLSGNPQKMAASGLGLLEERLGKFLMKERYYTHLQKFLHTGTVEADSMEQHIGQRRAGLAQEQGKLQRTYEEIQPKLAAIRKRREHLPLIIGRYRGECQRALRTSFEQMVLRLRQELPDLLQSRPIPSLKGGIIGLLTDTVRQKKLCQEAIELCNQIVTERISAWSRTEAVQVLQPKLESLFLEIEDEAEIIGSAYDDIHFQLTGWTAKGEATNIVSTKERVLSGIAGFFVGDFTILLGPAGGGWRSLVGALAGNFGASFVLAAIGLSGGLLLVPALIAGVIGALVGGHIGLEGRLKKKAAEIVGPELQKLPLEAGAAIDREVEKELGKVEAAIMQQVLTVIQEEEQNIQQMLESSKQSMEEKAKEMAALEEASKRIAAQRKLLKDVETKAKQVA